VGGQLLYGAFINEGMNRISLDLNSAREIYANRTENVELSLEVTTIGDGFRDDLAGRDVASLGKRLRRLARQARLDFAGIVLEDGSTLCRIGPAPIPDPSTRIANPIAAHALESEAPVSGTVVLGPEFMRWENPAIAQSARILLVPTPRAVERPEHEETEGMALAAAVPVIDDGEVTGVLYGGILLNGSTEIVDRVRDTVFKNESFDGRSVGTATIFLRDTRISTNVLTSAGERAIGTRVSREVRQRVLIDGKKWSDRAFVVSDWYITAYEPITDVSGERVGMLYVGVLEAKYSSVQWKALSIFFLLSIAGITLAFVLGFVLSHRITLPVKKLVEASEQVGKGNFSPDLGRRARGELGVLQKTFGTMLASLRQRDERIKAESETTLLRYEKQASVGRLAAGVAHEINNPLTGVLTFTHLLLRRKDLPDEVRSDLAKVAEQTDRVRTIVKGLLDFSRQTRLDKEPSDLNRLVRSTISLIENQALVRGVTLSFHPGDHIPTLTLDRNQMQSVILNILLNALDATRAGDAVTIHTGVSVLADKGDHRGVEIVIADTGCGIPVENLDRLFDPFFSTKDVGQGTGLGLAVSYGIVERHGGHIRVQSEVGQGSTFTIWLPDGEKEERDENTDRR
jgi:two-component system NtrC family sensor kinase